MPVPGERLADRYRIVALLGAGGMATVHRAHDERLDRDVAVKTLLPNLAGDPVLARRFEREARSMAAVADPGLVAVYDVEPGDPATGREPFVVMELCPGGSLADRLGVGRAMAPDDLVPILVAVASAIEALHRAGLVHRDVKPSNVLFAADRVKLGDFGLVRSDTAEASDLTDPGTAVGTLAYLSPERLRGEAGGPPADIYALGTIAHLGLTGAMPRPTGSLRDAVAAAAFRPPSVSSVAPALGTAFDEAVLRSLAIDPGRRPAALDFGVELSTALGRWRRTRGPSTVPAVAAAAGSAIDHADTSAPTALDLTPTTALDVGPPHVEPRADADGPARAARSSTPWIGAAIVVLAIAAVLLLPRLLGGTAPPGSSPAVGGLASPSFASPSGASPSPSTSPSAGLSPSPTVGPTATIDPVTARLDDVDAAIAAARGGPDGLKGKQANELAAQAAKVRRDVQAGQRAAALHDARDLDRRARDVGEDLDEARANRLTAATAALVRALGG